MNKLRLSAMSILLLTNLVANAQITSPAPYCGASYDDGFMPVPHYISNVSLGTLNNTTGTTQFAAPHYAYYNTVGAPNLVRGSSYPISISHNGGVTIHFVAVYIDYNRNNNFNDPGELVLQQNIVTGAVTNPSTATITIPTSATLGTTRMRVMVFEDDDYTWGSGSSLPTPCTADASGSFDWGETEDYNVNITGGATPAGPVAAFTGTPLTGTTATNFTFTDASTNTPTSWKWTFTPNTVAYQGGTASTSANPVVKFTANGTYTVKLKVANATGADSLTRTNYITVAGTVPVPAFSVSPTTSGTTATIFTFTDMSTNTPNAWQWTFSPTTASYQAGTSATSANPKVRFTTNGLYTVKLRVANTSGADSLIKLNYVLVGTTGLTDITNESGAIVFPNPANDLLHIELQNKTASISSVAIYNYSGKLVYQTDKCQTVDVSSLANGQYVAVIYTNEGICTSNVTIQR